MAGDPLRVGEVAVERGLEVLDERVHPVMVALHRVLAARHGLERSVELREIGGFDEHLELPAVPETEFAPQQPPVLDLAVAFEPPEVRLERGDEFEIAYSGAQVDRDLVHVQDREAYVVWPALPGERRRYRGRMAPPPIDIVLFDLGGVLIEFGGVEAMRALAGIDSDDELWRRWLTCRWVRSLERGDCSPADFAGGMVS